MDFPLCVVSNTVPVLLGYTYCIIVSVCVCRSIVSVCVDLHMCVKMCRYIIVSVCVDIHMCVKMCRSIVSVCVDLPECVVEQRTSRETPARLQ